MGSGLEVLAAIVSGLLTALGGAASSGLFEASKRLIDHWLKREPIPDLALTRDNDRAIEALKQVIGGPAAGFTNPRFRFARQQVMVRIRDAQQAREKQLSIARWSRWSANSLTFGQYVIGGVMATSFVQKALSSEIVGVFGILVVAASLLKQHYHPDVNAQNSAQMAGQLEALIRQSEDRLVVIEATTDPNEDNPALVLELLERISAEITRITLSPVETAGAARAVAQRRGK